MKIKIVTMEERKKNEILAKQMINIEKQEDMILNKKENAFIKEKITPVMDKIQDKIPDNLQSLLDSAFYTSFQLVFEKGITYIERTYNKNKLLLEYDLNNYAVNKDLSNRRIRNLDKQSNLSTALNSSIAVIEGGVLGVLGIGLPDIPLFIAVLIRTINEIALSYGYQYDTKEEKAFLLNLICTAMAKGENQKTYDTMADRLIENIDSDIFMDIDLDKRMKETSKILSEALLTVKFIQGIPIVGVIGSAVNHSIVNKVGRYAQVKYKKRYLLSKMKEESDMNDIDE